MGRLVLADGDGALVPGDGGHGFGSARLGGVDGLQDGVVQGQQLVNRNGLAGQGDHGDLGGLANAAGMGQVDVLGQLGHDAAHLGKIPADVLHTGLEADPVAEGHLHHGLGQAVLHSPGGLYLPGLAQGVELLPGGLAGLRIAGTEEVNGMARGLELGGEDLFCLHGGDGEGNEGGGHVLVQEGAGHGILAADGGHPQLQLGVQSAQQGGEGLAPALRLVPQLLKELLKGQVGLFIIGAGGHNLGHGGIDGVVGPLVGIGGQGLRVTTPGHDAGLVSLLAGQDGEQGGHGLGGGALGLAAEGHQDAARPDGAVKPLGQSPAAGALQAGGHLPQGGGGLRSCSLGLGDRDAGVLHRAVGVQKFTGEVGHGLALPVHDHPGTLGDHGHLIGLQVLRLSGGDEPGCVLRGDDHGHALLALGDGKLRAVQALVLLAYCVQLDLQAVGQLADGHGHAAGAEVVAPLDEAGDLSVPKQTLDLPLLGGVALLDLGGHGGQGLLVVAL